MPLETKTGSEQEKEENFDELCHGKTYAKTRRKHGGKAARSQMIAIALKAQREGEKNKRKHTSGPGQGGKKRTRKAKTRKTVIKR